jgi:hypothetical protein
MRSTTSPAAYSAGECRAGWTREQDPRPHDLLLGLGVGRWWGPLPVSRTRILQRGPSKMKIVFEVVGPDFGCHMAATRRGKVRDLEGRTGKRLRCKPAWSLRGREMVDHLGLPRQGSSPPSRTT